MKTLKITQANKVSYTFEFTGNKIIEIKTSTGNIVKTNISKRVNKDGELIIWIGDNVKNWKLDAGNAKLVNDFLINAESELNGRKLVTFETLSAYINRDTSLNYGEAWADKNGNTCAYLYS